MKSPPGTPTRRGFMTAGAATAAIAVTPHIAEARATAPHELSFLVLGDWGHGADIWGVWRDADKAMSQRKVASAMAERAEISPIDFVISTGDNFYPAGAIGVRDPIFWSAFEEVYAAKSLSCPWYLVLGNHDRKGRPMAQVAYSSVSARWTMPSRFHLQNMTLAGGETVDFFFLDTSTIRKEAAEIPDPEGGGGDDNQLDWLDQVLSASNATWKIAVGHHPVYSGGKHGNTGSMLEHVQPLFREHGVHAYLNGHDHDLQHIEVDKIHYFTSGGGASCRSVESLEGTRFAAATTGFLAVRLAADDMHVEFVDARGRSLYSGRLARNGD